MPIGPITPGIDTIVTPDAGSTGYASLPSPSPTMPVVAANVAALTLAALNIQQFLLELVTGLNASGTLGRIGKLEIVGPGLIQIDNTAYIDVLNGGEVRYESGGVSNYKLGAALNLLLGAHLLWAKGSLPLIQTVVNFDAVTGGPSGALFKTGTSLGVQSGGVFALDSGALATNDSAFSNTGTFVDTGPSAGHLDTQNGGIDADHVYVIGASWITKIWANANTAARKYAFSHTNAVQGRKVIVTFGDIAGATGTSLELRDGSLVGTVLITLGAVSGTYMSAELTYTGAAWYVSQPGVRL